MSLTERVECVAERRLHGARILGTVCFIVTQAQRVAWMREYRKALEARYTSLVKNISLRREFVLTR
jgi:hypothetical protein